MPELVVRDVEEDVVRKLKERAREHGVSVEEEHRRILRKALCPSPEPLKLTFMEHLMAMPEIPEEAFRREIDPDRNIEW
jgi:plasmid stability protein